MCRSTQRDGVQDPGLKQRVKAAEYRAKQQSRDKQPKVREDNGRR
jgi:hypothetical protein